MSLRGALLRVEYGDVCETEECAGKAIPATKCVQGETDSFGHEHHPMCASCYAKYQVAEQLASEKNKTTLEYCDWCKKEALDVRDHRDYEEGRGGPVYSVCKECRHKEAAALNDEVNYYQDDED